MRKKKQYIESGGILYDVDKITAMIKELRDLIKAEKKGQKK